ncbi:44025_t:CDS:1 [Gigaspora margarita]|uniref:44025_t:CDS:1 n=1 Tax=Gigaspora margarita TaxID=4874 RepID=A0ABN7W3D6_GIGMA|nr:44025_t:CDS:1 [Gigaspora margarita]
MSNSAQVYREFLTAKKIFETEEKNYLLVLLKLLQVVSESSDYEDAFVTYNKIKNEGNDDFKRQVKFKLGLHLLAGAGCRKNIAKRCKLIIETKCLGFFPAKRWTIKHGKKIDYGAEEAYKLFR